MAYGIAVYDDNEILILDTSGAVKTQVLDVVIIGKDLS